MKKKADMSLVKRYVSTYYFKEVFFPETPAQLA